MPSDKRKPRPGGNGRGFLKINSVNSDNPEHSPDQLPSQGLILIGPIAAQIVADLKFRRQVVDLHALGPRVTAELLAEIGAERGIQIIIDRKLETYVGLDAAAIEAAGGDQFWPAPLHKVRRTP